MQPEQFFHLASVLGNGQTEVEWRTAISRAYYGLFHVVRHWIQQLGFRIPQDAMVHRYLILRMSNAQFPALVRAGKTLDRMRDVRNLADYDLRNKIDQAVALEAVLETKSAIDDVRQACQDRTISTMITDVIRAYERDVLKDPTWQPPKK